MAILKETLRKFRNAAAELLQQSEERALFLSNRAKAWKALAKKYKEQACPSD